MFKDNEVIQAMQTLIKNRQKKSNPKKGKFIIRTNGLPLVQHEKIESLKDAKTLANNMYNSGHYPVVSNCFAAGINGDWENGICPIYRLDKTECTCEEHFTDFEEILKEEKQQLK